MGSTLNKGIYYPVLVPFDKHENVDHDTLTDLLEFGIDRGMHGVFALGSVGQGPVMGVDQRKEALETMVEVVDGQVPLIAHIGTPDTQSSIELARHAEDVGVDMIGSLAPFYYTSSSSSSMAHDSFEIEAHFRRIAASVDVDFLVYNNHKFTGVDLKPGMIGELAEEIPTIRGLKSGSTSRAIEGYVEQTPQDFMVFTNILYLLPSVYNGIHGSINPPTSVFPEVCVDYWDAIQNRDLEAALEYRRTLRAISQIAGDFGTTYRRGIYNGLFELRGIQMERYPKWESKPITDDDQQQLRSRFEEIGLGEYLV